MKDDFNKFLAALSEQSEDEFIDPTTVKWPAGVDADAWYFSPELISLYGSDTWESLDEQQQKRLSFAEAVNFFSLNIHGEKHLISEISKRLYDEDSELSRYLLHFVDEEARHMMYFSGFCHRYAGKIYSDRTIHNAPSGDEERDMFCLFARINVFEEIVDHYNRTMANDKRLEPIVREINRIHHVEEMRHLNFGRHFLTHCIDKYVGSWSAERREELRTSLGEYVELVWKQYYNPNAYKDAGIDDSFEIWQGVYGSPRATAHRAEINQRRLSYLRKLDLLEAA